MNKLEKMIAELKKYRKESFKKNGANSVYDKNGFVKSNALLIDLLDVFSKVKNYRWSDGVARYLEHNGNYDNTYGMDININEFVEFYEWEKYTLVKIRNNAFIMESEESLLDIMGKYKKTIEDGNYICEINMFGTPIIRTKDDKVNSKTYAQTMEEAIASIQ